ncbi:MAG: hypothetical protein RLZZ585_846 [Bacteroidota bacterium]
MNNLSVDHLTGIKDLTRQDIELIFKTADSFKEVINRPHPSEILRLPIFSLKILLEQDFHSNLLKKDFQLTLLILVRQVVL